MNPIATLPHGTLEPNCDLCKSSLCCRHWDVVVSERDVTRLREGLGCSEAEFQERYLGREIRWSAEFRWQLGRTHDAIGEKPSVRDPAQLRSFVRELAVDYLAVGLDPDRAVFFRQSDVPEVAELAWILSTVTPMGLLERCHSFKDKIAKGIEANHGLFAYPVLMAADILIYDSERVPVGEDQIQHVEVTRDIAGYFNRAYGDVLVLPEHEVEPTARVIPGVDGKKMSKSYANTIEMFAPEKELKKRVMGITTDSKGVEEPKDPETNTIFLLYRLVATPEEASAMAERFRAGGYGYGDAKKELLAKLLDTFGPYRRRRDELLADLGQVDELLARGAKKARATARATLDRVRRAVGLA